MKISTNLWYFDFHLESFVVWHEFHFPSAFWMAHMISKTVDDSKPFKLSNQETVNKLKTFSIDFGCKNTDWTQARFMNVPCLYIFGSYIENRINCLKKAIIKWYWHFYEFIIWMSWSQPINFHYTAMNEKFNLKIKTRSSDFKNWKHDINSLLFRINC